MKTCQNVVESCHEPIGSNPYDLCDGCLWWNALYALRTIAKTQLQGYMNHNHLMDFLNKWLIDSPEILADFEELFKENKVYALLKLEHELLKQAPEGVRDNQPSISDILNLPF